MTMDDKIRARAVRIISDLAKIANRMDPDDRYFIVSFSIDCSRHIGDYLLVKVMPTDTTVPGYLCSTPIRTLTDEKLDGIWKDAVNIMDELSK